MSPRDLFETIKSRLFTDNTKGMSSTKGKRKSPLSTLIILFVFGVTLMLISHIYGSQLKEKSPPAHQTAETASVAKDVATFKSQGKKSFNSMEDYATYYEERLKEILNKVMGVSDVDVMITLETSTQNVYEKDENVDQTHTTEEDHSGGTRESIQKKQENKVVIIDGGSGKGPIVVTKKSPVVQGVFVVAKGVENPTIKSWIVEAVSSVLDVPSYKVIVAPAN
jgi:stage III sporulation protein AG